MPEHGDILGGFLLSMLIIRWVYDVTAVVTANVVLNSRTCSAISLELPQSVDLDCCMKDSTFKA